MFFPEQEYKTSTKSEDELKKLTLEEDLSECQRSIYILTKGQQLQKKAVDYCDLSLDLFQFTQDFKGTQCF